VPCGLSFTVANNQIFGEAMLRGGADIKAIFVKVPGRKKSVDIRK
jgi:hypothetical protein